MDMRNNAVLELTVGDRTAAFQFSDELDVQDEVTHDPILSGRGQFAQRAIDFIIGEEDDPAAGADPRVGYHIDAGGGEATFAVNFTTGREDVIWGDGSGGDGPDNVTRWDASGAGVSKFDRKYVFNRWMKMANTGSISPGLWYHNQWTDGTYADSAGLEDRPKSVGILESSIGVESRGEEATAVEGSMTLVEIAEAPSIVEDARRKILDDIVDFG